NLPTGGGDLVPRPDGTVISLDGDDPADFAWWTNTVAVSTGYGFSLGLQHDGTVLASGDNSDGECDVPASLSNVVAIAAGGDHSLALRSDGTIVAWGSDTYGESTVPSYLGPVIAISAGFNDSMALVLPVTPSLDHKLTANGLVLSW